ncbi:MULTISPECIES: hypothetical protein [unclassified Novosphingobium]|uniref:hypothetical protein n=1 Tax=unclassified Novosphingobium TaxID=2644732 RepID=UPI000F5F43A6|nr:MULTISPECIES: hypothetical protein [unclassified Novosphingobium]MBF5090592.1 hypothetical protein [Novosphingobium sp. NBM11]RQW42553.1 hypothetical protein EH199_17220 [Novosphingobium sp. LASN5T]
MPAQTHGTGAGAPGALPQRFAETVRALARPQDIRALSLIGLHVVMAMRLCALFERAARDPVPDLAQRYRSVEAAVGVHDLVRAIVATWPEAFMVNRPCCLAMSPDEATLAELVRSTGLGDRARFDATIAGFVRSDRHERLFDATVRAVALLQACPA